MAWTGWARLCTALIVSCVAPRPAPAAESSTGSLRLGIRTLPLIDKQDIRFVRVAAEGESLESRVTSIAQDRYGFLWFGSDDGLYRYDGYKLKSFRREPGNPNSLSDDTVTAIYRDRTGILWVGTGFGGLNRFDPASGTFTHYRHDPSNRGSLSSNAARCIFQDAAGALWVGTANGLDRLDQTTGSFAHYQHNKQDAGSLSSNEAVDIFEDRSGNLWVGTIGGGLNILDRSTGRFTRFRESYTAASPGDDSSALLSSIRQDHAGLLWVGNGLGTLDPRTGTLTRYAFRSKDPGGEIIKGLRALQEGREGELWLGMQNGLLLLDRERKQFARYLKKPANPQSLHNDDILSLFQDAEGNIWVGTQSGVSRFNPRPLFTIRQHEPGNSQSLVENNIRAVQVDRQGNLWVGTRRGLQRFEPKTGRATLYQHDPHDPSSISNNYVTVIREDRSGVLWVGTGGGGLNRFDGTRGRFFAYRYQPGNPAGLSSDGVLSLLEDREGMLWVATAAGLSRLNRRTGRFTTYHHDDSDPHSLSDDLIKTVFEDRDGTLWVGTKGGLNRFDRASQHFTSWQHNAHDASSLSHDQVNAISEDRKGRLWLATQEGLDQMDRSRGTFTTFTREDGLPDNAVQSILEDDHGSLWLATHNGLARFRPASGTFRNYSAADGLPGNLLNPLGTESSCRGPDGQLWFGSRNGLVSFYPDRLADNPYVPPVTLTDFRLFNKTVHPGPNSPLQQPIWATRSLTLTQAQGIFSLEFAALSNTAPESNRYRFMLEGLETEWNEVSSRQRLATYTNLPAGNYVFRVQGSNNNQVWNQEGVSLAIVVLAPWWATWWFRSTVGLVIAGMAFGAYQSRVRILRLGAARLERQVSERTSELLERTGELQIAKDAAEAANRAKTIFLANMSHELRTPLNAILGFSNLLREGDVSEWQRNDLDIINRSGEHLLSLVDEVLDVAKIEAGRGVLEIAPYDLAGMVRDVMDMMGARAQMKGLALLHADSSGLPRYVRADGPRLRQVLINLVGNAIKFTPSGSVTLRLDAGCVDDDGRFSLTFYVEDTGCGVAPEDHERIFEPFVQVGPAATKKGSGLGLAITRQLVEMMGGTVSVESTPGKGSRFRVEVPVYAHEDAGPLGERTERGRITGLEPGQPEFRVLVCEDEPTSAAVLLRFLQSAGFQVKVADNGAKGVDLFQTWRPDFIWMDLRMPVMNGAEAAKRIRAVEGGRAVKIAGVSASAFAEERSEVLAAGMDDFVRKPFRAAEIFDCMARHLGVRYCRSESQPCTRQESPPPLRAEALAGLPQELRAELQDALAALDVERISAVVVRVTERDFGLGSTLSHYADRLEYTAIFQAIENCQAPEVFAKGSTE
uniref:histidine kinase n=1 Tax=Solibacter usitatus (strain Ellin6076) TaxID=234267 RepID=Q01X79_SOLUE